MPESNTECYLNIEVSMLLYSRWITTSHSELQVSILHTKELFVRMFRFYDLKSTLNHCHVFRLWFHWSQAAIISVAVLLICCLNPHWLTVNSATCCRFIVVPREAPWLAGASPAAAHDWWWRRGVVAVTARRRTPHQLSHRRGAEAWPLSNNFTALQNCIALP